MLLVPLDKIYGQFPFTMWESKQAYLLFSCSFILSGSFHFSPELSGTMLLGKNISSMCNLITIISSKSNSSESHKKGCSYFTFHSGPQKSDPVFEFQTLESLSYWVALCTLFFPANRMNNENK